MLPRILFGAFPVALAVVACSSDRGGGSSAGARPQPGEPDAGAPADETAGGGVRHICTTLDYGHLRSNDDYFLPFADDAAVLEYSKGFLLANEEPEAKEVSHDQRF